LLFCVLVFVYVVIYPQPLCQISRLAVVSKS